MDHVIADSRPGRAQFRVANVMAHAGRARRKDGDVGAAFALKFQLRGLQLLANLIVADFGQRGRRRGIGERGDLLLAKFHERPPARMCNVRDNR